MAERNCARGRAIGRSRSRPRASTNCARCSSSGSTRPLRAHGRCRITARNSRPPALNPGDVKSLDDLAKASLHDQGRSAPELSVRHVRGADERDRARARFERHHRQADGGRLYARRHRHVGHADGALDPRRRRQARRQDAHRLWLRPVHRGLGLSLRRRISRLRRHSGQRRLHRAPGAAHRRLQAGYHRGHAVLSARHRRRVRSPRHRRAQIVAAHRAARRGAVDRRRCAPRSSAAWVSTPSMSMGFRK